MDYKNLIRSTLNLLHLDLSKNLEYDRLTKLIMKRVIKPDSNCIDIGCHKGEILDIIIKYAPKGKHYGFEPLPILFDRLIEKFKNRATILHYALSDKDGFSTFHHVKNAPAYSGIKKRKYDIDKPEIEEIKVELKKLDDIIPSDLKIDFIKIDVEGGEFGVLKGGIQLLKKFKPIIIFEFGLGASDFYGTNPADMFTLITKELGLQIFLLKSFIKNHKALNLMEFEQCFNDNKEYYFIAHK
ncbi:MAG: methyltransferase FkbM [Bacteroidetes bacterium]|nr:methyltransferase FkbM [Bacteroidota bacterium]|tara:strand:+ start:2861 stop:3583 length:723 start_codon:yes stop_codon:yes gene_type:complete